MRTVTRLAKSSGLWSKAMSQENVEIVRQNLGAFDRRDRAGDHSLRPRL
jgi:hypothetical protein